MVVFGTSNIKNNPDEVDKMSKDLGLKVNQVTTYKYVNLKENIKKIDSKDRYVVVHVLGNDARNIGDKNYLSRAEKLQKASDLAVDAAYFLNDFSQKNSHLQVFFSTLLYREDDDIKEFLRKKINSKIRQKLNKVHIHISFNFIKFNFY